MNKKWLTIGLAVALTSTALVGCGDNKTAEENNNNTDAATKPDAKQELNLILTDEIPTMDRSLATDSLSFTVLGQTGEGLTRYGKDGKIEGAVAEKWDVSKDGKTYTFHLREGAKWSNGDPVTAHDFEYSWKRTLNPETGAQYAFLVSWIKGGEAFMSGQGSADQLGVKALDDKTLEVTLENPSPIWIDMMAFPIFFPQNEKFEKEAGDKYGGEADKILSNGPFKMSEWIHDQSVTLVKNDTYWDKDTVILEKVNYQVVKDTAAYVNLYESGQIDRTGGLVADLVDSFKDNPEFTVIPELTNGYLQYNLTKNKALSNKKIRQALTYAVDGDAFADIIYHNGTKGATGFVPDGVANGMGGDFRKDNGDLLKRAENVKKAKQLFEEGMKELGLTEFPTLKLLASDGDIGKKATEFIQAQWKTNLGITVEPEHVPFKLRLKKTDEHDFDIVWSLWSADYNDPMTFLDMYLSDSSYNAPQWKNEKFDQLIQQAKVEMDKKKRNELMMEAEQIMMDEMPVGPLFFRASAVLQKPYVKDLFPRVSGPSYDLHWAYIQGKE